MSMTNKTRRHRGPGKGKKPGAQRRNSNSRGRPDNSRGGQRFRNNRGGGTRSTMGRDTMADNVRSTRTRSGTFEDLFADHSKEIKATANRLREIIMEVLPGAEEKVYLGWKIALYNLPTEVCGIQSVNKYCNLYFSKGAQMSDPHQLLEGTGKSIRHVKVRSVDDMPVDQLKDLIREAHRLVK
jgi:hypothetical protein